MADLVGSKVAEAAISRVTDEAIDSVWRQIGYIWNYNTNIHDLEDQLLRLKAERQSMLHCVDEARRNGEEIEDTVTIWLKGVDDAIEAAEEVLRGNGAANKSCFAGCCPNLKTRHQFSRKAKKETTPALARAQQERSLIHRISHALNVQEFKPVKNYEALESRMEVLKEIVKTLKNDDVNFVGVYGLGGVGKTTLVKQQVAAQVKEEGVFKAVAIANVTPAWDLSKIQQEIADWLGLKFDIESIEVRAVRLRARLKQEKKVLVVLDDIWEKIQLEKIGIPDKDDHEGCKVLMTSRSLSILLEMGVKRHFLLQVLPQEEAWQLFEKQAGDLKNPKLQSIAIEVAKRCAGLPVLIVAVAISLRDKELVEWNDALEQLQKFDSKGMKAQVYPALELSYNSLGDDAKSLLILCGQLPNDIFHISDLLKYAMGLNLFHKCTTIKVLRNRLLKVVNDLKRSCLLLEGDYNEYVTMHGVVHGFAASIASKQHNVFPTAYDCELVEWPEKEAFELCSAICLPCSKIPELPQVLNCPKLESFILYNHDPSLVIPNDFFSRAKRLKLADLSDVNLLPLPLSLCFLQNLQTLCLDRCVFEDISAIGNLNKLQVLSLIGSNIVQLPMEIRNLTGLQLLDLSKCRRLEVIPPGILKCLINLEELYMVDSFVEWGDEGHIGETKHATLSELKVLPHLINLEIHIIDAKIMPVDLLHWKLERFKILIGDDWDSYGNYDTSKILKLKLSTGSQLDRVKILLMETEDLYLDDLRGVKNMLPRLEIQGFHELKHLQVQNCHEMQFIIDRTRMGDIVTFPSLESLSIVNLNKLEKIYYGAFAASSFNNLKKLKVGNCKVLKNLFSFSMFKCLIQLQELNVNQCEILKEIVALRYDDEEDDVKHQTIMLTQLCSLTLEDLPQLEAFCSPEAASGTMLLVDEFEHLFSRKIQFPNLTELKLSSINVENIYVNHSIQFGRLEKLTTLIVDGCGNLAYVFTSSMVRSLVQLKRIEICDCKSMEEVISTVRETKEEMIFPKLITLKMKGLQRVVRFCTSSSIQCPSLKELCMQNCPRLQTFVSKGARTSNEAGQQDWNLFDEKVEFPCLEVLIIVGVNVLKIIWGNEFREDSFCKLIYLQVGDANELVRIFPPNQLRKFMNIEKLVIRGCGALTALFDIRKEESAGVAISQLQKLLVNDSSNLKHIWNEDPKEVLDFQHLSLVNIIGCPSLESVFPASVARGLVHLENILIYDSGVEEIIAGDQGEEVEAVLEFPNLKYMQLRRLPKLERFCPTKHTSEWPALKELFVTACTKFHQLALLYNKIIPNLEGLALNGKDVAMIREGRLPLNLFHKLKCVELNYYNDYSRVFPFDLLPIFSNLETLQVSRSKFKELFPLAGLGDDEKHPRIGTNIHSLRLFRHPNLKNIWNEVLQTLESLKIEQCDSLTILAPSSASFQSLTSLDISKCNGLVSLVTSSTAKSLMRLEKLRVRMCNKVEVIVSDEENETINEITFIKLESLELDCLPSLISFCSASHRFKFPSLIEVVINQCPKMEFFSKGISITPLLQSVQGDWLGNLNSTINFLYKKMVGFNGVQHLQVSKFSNLQKIWHGELPVQFFFDLRSLVVDVATFSSYAVSSSLLEYLNKLEKLDLNKCEVFEVFDLQGLNEDDVGQNGLLSKLNWFHLSNLPRLRHIWNEHPQRILNFKHLKLLKVENCSSLRMIFTPSMTRSLVQLQEMEVKNCTSVEEIVTVGAEEIGTDDIITFPQLNSVVLHSLPNLSSFHPGRGLVQCPSLEKITVMDCPRIGVFTSSVDENLEPVKIDEGNPIFFGKVKCPGIKEFRVDWSNTIEKIWDGKLVTTLELFCSLKVLELKHFPVEYSVLRSNFLNRSPNLEELLVSDASFEELFSQKGTSSEEESSMKAIPLRRFTLSKLPQLRHLIKEETVSGSLIQHLEALEVWECSNLIMLVPSSISFHNLKTLKVSKCHGLIKLITSATARSLWQLARLEITECETVEEIVGDRDEVETEISFSKLKHLELGCLPKLISFCSGNAAFNFPRLEEIIVRECPKMELFAVGELSTPNLMSVQIAEDENEWCWEGNLNATIQKLFTEMNAKKVEG